MAQCAHCSSNPDWKHRELSLAPDNVRHVSFVYNFKASLLFPASDLLLEQKFAT